MEGWGWKLPTKEQRAGQTSAIAKCACLIANTICKNVNKYANGKNCNNNITITTTSANRLKRNRIVDPASPKFMPLTRKHFLLYWKCLFSSLFMIWLCLVRRFRDLLMLCQFVSYSFLARNEIYLLQLARRSHCSRANSNFLWEHFSLASKSNGIIIIFFFVFCLWILQFPLSEIPVISHVRQGAFMFDPVNCRHVRNATWRKWIGYEHMNRKRK